MGVPLPFSKRTTSAISVFACLFIASPQGAQSLTTNGETRGTLSLEYGQLLAVYPRLLHQDTANNQADLYVAIAKAYTIVSNLHTTIDGMTASGAAAFQLNGMQIVVANALVALGNVQGDE